MSAAARFITTKKVGTLAAVVPLPGMALATGVGLAQGCSGPGIRKAKPARFAPDRIGAPIANDVREDLRLQGRHR